MMKLHTILFLLLSLSVVIPAVQASEGHRPTADPAYYDEYSSARNRQLMATMGATFIGGALGAARAWRAGAVPREAALAGCVGAGIGAGASGILSVLYGMHRARKLVVLNHINNSEFVQTGLLPVGSLTSAHDLMRDDLISGDEDDDDDDDSDDEDDDGNEFYINCDRFEQCKVPILKFLGARYDEDELSRVRSVYDLNDKIQACNARWSAQKNAAYSVGVPCGVVCVALALGARYAMQNWL